MKHQPKQQPSLWLTRDKLAGASIAPQRWLLVGYRLYTNRTHTTAAGQSPTRQEDPVFTLSDSSWILPALQDAGLGDDAAQLEGSLVITLDTVHLMGTSSQLDGAPRGGGSKRRNTPGLTGEIAVELRIQPELECSRCATLFRAPIVYTEQLRIVDEETLETMETRTPRPVDNDEESESAPLGMDSLDVVELGPKGLALDALLLDTLAGALPDLPRCPTCSSLSEPTDS